MGPADLEQIIATLHDYEDPMSGSGKGSPAVLIGPGDDGGITLIGDTAIEGSSLFFSVIGSVEKGSSRIIVK